MSWKSFICAPCSQTSDSLWCRVWSLYTRDHKGHAPHPEVVTSFLNVEIILLSSTSKDSKYLSGFYFLMAYMYIFAISSTLWNRKALIPITSLIQEEILQPPVPANTPSRGHPHLQFHVNIEYSVIFYLQETLLTCRSSNHICLFFSCKKLENASMLYKQKEKNLEELTSVITSSIQVISRWRLLREK